MWTIPAELEEAVVRNPEAYTAVAVLTGGFFRFIVCDPGVRVWPARARGRAVGRYGDLRAFSLPGLIIPAKPYGLFLQRVHAFTSPRS